MSGTRHIDTDSFGELWTNLETQGVRPTARSVGALSRFSLVCIFACVAFPLLSIIVHSFLYYSLAVSQVPRFSLSLVFSFLSGRLLGAYDSGGDERFPAILELPSRCGRLHARVDRQASPDHVARGDAKKTICIVSGGPPGGGATTANTG